MQEMELNAHVPSADVNRKRENGQKLALILHNGFLRAKSKRVNISLLLMFSRDVLMLAY